VRFHTAGEANLSLLSTTAFVPYDDTIMETSVKAWICYNYYY